MELLAAQHTAHTYTSRRIRTRTPVLLSTRVSTHVLRDYASYHYADRSLESKVRTVSVARTYIYLCARVRIYIYICIGIPCQPRMHYIVWNFRYKCLKGLITAVPISLAIIPISCHVSFRLYIYIYSKTREKRRIVNSKDRIEPFVS